MCDDKNIYYSKFVKRWVVKLTDKIYVLLLLSITYVNDESQHT